MNLVALDWGNSRSEGQPAGSSHAHSPMNPPPRPDSRKNKLFEGPNDKQN